LVAQGALELNLIAEDTNQWGQDRRDGRNLSHLLRALGEIEGLRWLRILYAYPSYFTEDLIDEIANNPKASRPALRRVSLPPGRPCPICAALLCCLPRAPTPRPPPSRPRRRCASTSTCRCSTSAT
jgi:hypothetical protein